ncbi:translation initiation factor if-3 [Diplodia corticola]|uniref:Translation initiation factor if-3 n=1 Tax=Diplodia corticola TaxID=236234 RepID=A0A1J9RRF6_9PEZI|nr:translation initiation factor if-3 [Diplodia corticola]OJD30484.1 translation initiation factor if-3 [Diplodia corticola]
MAHTRQISTTAQALFRVFIQPTVSVAPATPRAASFIRPSAAPTIFIPALTPHNQRRAASKYRPPVERSKPYDEEIGSIYINLIDEEGVFRPRQRLRTVLNDMDRIMNHLVQLDAPTEESEHPFPVCKIVAKTALREQERTKARLKAKKNPDELAKTIELNWAVSPNDLQHWMKRLKEFLQEGRRVEVAMGPKKRGRKATMAEASHVLETVRQTVAEVEGAKERIEPEGQLGAIMVLSFDGPKVDEEAKKQRIQQEKEMEVAENAANGKKDQPKVSRWKVKEEERRKQAEAEKLEKERIAFEEERIRQERWQRQQAMGGGRYNQGFDAFGRAGYGGGTWGR